MGGTAARARYPRAGEGSVDDHGHGTMRAERAKRCTAADEDGIGRRLRSAILDIGHQGLSHFVRQRQTRVAASLATDVNPGAFPVKVAQPQMHDVAGPQTQPSEQQQNRPITGAALRRGIAGLDHALHIVRS
jgi:hypothetical protein